MMESIICLEMFVINEALMILVCIPRIYEVNHVRYVGARPDSLGSARGLEEH